MAVVITVVMTIPLDTKFLWADSWTMPGKDYVNFEIPYEISSAKVFWFTHVFEMAVIHALLLMFLNFDTFIAGHMLQVTAQIEIIKYKIMSISTLENELVYDAYVGCVKHHITICRFKFFQINFFYFLMLLENS